MRIPGGDLIFLLYLGTIMIPFVMLIIRLCQLSVVVGWLDKLTALVWPRIFAADGTFLMRQFFMSMPREIEVPALLDGASRFEVLWHISRPHSMPGLAILPPFIISLAQRIFVESATSSGVKG